MFELVDGWNLVRTPDDWAEYKKQFTEYQGWVTDQVAWGADPVKYPAMVVSYAPIYAKVVSCYFYEDEASKLLEADNQRKRYNKLMAGTVDELVPPDRVFTRVNTVGPRQMDTNKHVAATLLSITQIMLDKGLISASAFEKKMIANMAAVDGFMAEHREQVLKSVDMADMLPKLLHEEDNASPSD